jgi:hypothetical protein
LWIYTLFWEARDGQRGQWNASHGPHIINRVKCRNTSEVVRVINNRGEKIDSLNNCQVVAKAVYTRVVGCIKTDNQVFVDRLSWQLAQNLSE